MFTDDIFQLSTGKKHTRFWLISDLQQSNPQLAERYFHIALDDMLSSHLNENLDGICYLGDAAEFPDADNFNKMTEMQVGLLEQFDLPVFYTIGNHELDYFHYRGGEPVIPFYEYVKNRKLWHVIPDQEAFYFVHETEEFTMLFFSDHLAKDGSWCGTHQYLPPPEQPYPYTKEVWQKVRDQYADTGKPVFTFAHCAFPGGSRPSEYLAQMMPLPDNFRAHFHGHAHIGDSMWAGENLYRQISGTENHPMCQFNISSLDHLRGTAVRSAFFDYCGDGEYAVFFRDHLNRRWEQVFISEYNAKEAGIPECRQNNP